MWYSCLENPMERGAWLQAVGSQRIRYNWVTKLTQTHAHKNHAITPILPVFSFESILASCLKCFSKRSFYKINGEKFFFLLKASLLRCFGNITSGEAELKCLGLWVCLKAFFPPFYCTFYWRIVDLQCCADLCCQQHDLIIHLYTFPFKYYFPLCFFLSCS